MTIRFWTDRAQLFVLHVLLRLVDLALLLVRPRVLYAYLVIWFLEWRCSPYRWPTSFEAIRVTRRAGQTLQELVYGETPLCTGVWLLHRAGLRRGDHFVDLCAGRGRALLAARWLGARATGFEILREHVDLVAAPLAIAGAAMHAGDGAKANLCDATHVYLTWTGFTEATTQRFCELLHKMGSGTRVIAIDRPVPGTNFETISRHDVVYTWGRVPVWVQEYRREPPC